MRLRLIVGLAAVMGLAACGTSSGNQQQEVDAAAQFKIGPPLATAEQQPQVLDEYPCGDDAGGNSKKVKICHIPPGNPEQRHTLCIGRAAVTSHLKEHRRGTLGDYLGPCAREDQDDDDHDADHDGDCGGATDDSDSSGGTDTSGDNGGSADMGGDTTGDTTTDPNTDNWL